MQKSQIKTLTKYAWTFVGKPYKWGGDDPSGFDCSGLIVELLKAIGKLEEGDDLTAQGLHKFHPGAYIPSPSECCLVFYGKPDKVTHVAYCISDTLMIEAGNGGSFVKTEEDAIKYNAFVRVRPINRRRDIVGFMKLYS